MRISRALLAISLGGAIVAGLGASAHAARNPICVDTTVAPASVHTALGSVGIGGSKQICV